MGLFQSLFGGAPKPHGRNVSKFETLSAYTPQFSKFSGTVYESELVRAAINVRATHISKLHVEAIGTAKPGLRRKLMEAPNGFQTWSQFLYRLSTILDVQNTAFIFPVFDDFGQKTGVFPVLPTSCKLVQMDGVPYLSYQFQNGQHGAMELSEVGIMTKFQYDDDFFGKDNKALFPTMELINIQNQGIEEGVKSAATFRFLAQLDNFAKDDDIKKKRDLFNEQNFGRESGGGLLLFPTTMKNIQQIDSKPFVVDAEQVKIIKENVYEYFGVNDDILQNKAFGDAWTAFYEGAIEPFAIQFSDVLTKMLFSRREISEGTRIQTSANRLQYMSNKDKMTMAEKMADRGIMTRNELRELFNLSPLPEEVGNQLPVRGEYYNVGEKSETEPEPEQEPAEDNEEEGEEDAGANG